MNIKTELTMEDFKEMHGLEQKYYGEDHITPWEEAWQWYCKYPWYNAVLEDQGKIVGFLDMFPLSDDVFESLKAGTYNDSSLKAENIADITAAKGGIFHMFLCCLVVEKEYRKLGALPLLFQHQIDFYSQFIDGNIEIDCIITDNVTEEGCGFSERMGFEKVIDTQFDSVIYMQAYNRFIQNFA